MIQFKYELADALDSYQAERTYISNQFVVLDLELNSQDSAASDASVELLEDNSSDKP